MSKLDDILFIYKRDGDLAMAKLKIREIMLDILLRSVSSSSDFSEMSDNLLKEYREL